MGNCRPGVCRGQSLCESAYLGNDLDYIALFSGPFKRRCHIIVEPFDDRYNMQCWLGIKSLSRGQTLLHSLTKHQLETDIARYHNRASAAWLDHDSRWNYHHYSEYYEFKPLRTDRPGP